MPENSININTKLPGIEQSIFSQMTALSNEYKAINLAQGFPNFHPSPSLVSMVNKYMVDGMNQYAPMPGILPLREKIAEKTNKLYKASYNPDTEITILPGATNAIYTIISAFIKENDEVIIFEPAYDCYIPAILLNNGSPRFVTLQPPTFSINWDEVKKMINYKTKMIIINTPHNPTGGVFKEEDFRALEKLIKDSNILVLSDEVYEHIVFDGKKHLSILNYPELRNRTIAVSSFGKTYHTTGWKMGYAIAVPELTNEIRKVFSYSSFSVNTPMQYAYAEILDNEELYLSLSDFYQAKRDLFFDAMKGSSLKPLHAEGAYFACFEYGHISSMSDKEYAIRLIKEIGVASIPLSAFYHDKYDPKVLRFCFAKTDDVLLQAAEKLSKI